MKVINPSFNGTTCRMKSWRHLNGVQSACKTGVLKASNPKGLHFDHVMIYNRSLNGSEIQGHYLADYRGGTVSLYIDGILATDGNFAPGGDDFSGELLLGSDENAQANLSFNGSIDSLAVYEKVISDSSVRYNYKATYHGLSRDYIHKGDSIDCAIIVDETGPENGTLVAYFGFDEGTGNRTYSVK